MLRTNLGDEYVEQIFKVWDDNEFPRNPIFAVIGLKRPENKLKIKKRNGLGLLATQGIRGGANRKVLERIKETGDIFFAISDRNWILDGATVHVSMVGFD